MTAYDHFPEVVDDLHITHTGVCACLTAEIFEQENFAYHSLKRELFVFREEKINK